MLSAKDVSHRYATGFALKSVSFALPDRGVVTLIGNNGAGKSTLLNLICGIFPPTFGSVSLVTENGILNDTSIRAFVGYAPQKAALYYEYSVEEYLKFCCKLRRIPKRNIALAVTYAIERCRLGSVSKRLIGGLSGGYQQRVGIAQTLLHRPRIIALDEPTNGLDPGQILSTRSLIQELSSSCLVVLSTHILSEVEALQAEVLMLDQGRIVFSGGLNEFCDSNHVGHSAAIDADINRAFFTYAGRGVKC